MRIPAFISDLRRSDHKPKLEALKIFKFIGPGLLVTVGFIDPGNWASNIAGGATFGYNLLWVVSLSTIMLIVLQHNVAHLGIKTGLCLSESATAFTPRWFSRTVLSSAMLASVATSLAEILGSAIALEMLFHIPIPAGAILVALFSAIMVFSKSYRIIEKIIIGFVSIIGLSFLYELSLVNIDWVAVGVNTVRPSFPKGSIFLIMSILGAVVMPHNLFLHSEIIQSRQWNLENEEVIKKQLDFEFVDTLFSMIVGWAINSAMIILAVTTFYNAHVQVNDLQQVKGILTPLLGVNSGFVFAIALLFAGAASTITSAMAGGSIFAGIFSEPYDVKDNHTKLGILISLGLAFVIILFVNDPFKALIFSQMVLSIQLPFTIFLQIYLTSSKKVMGKYANSLSTKLLLVFIGAIVTGLNLWMFFQYLF